MSKKARISLSIVSLLGSVAIAHAQEATAKLPGGAGSVTEVFEDWVVGCQAAGGKIGCTLSQEQTNNGGQRLLLINIEPAKEGAMNGTVVLPFGLLLQRGIRMRIDEGAWSENPLHFDTCQPVGCIIHFQFPSQTARSLQKGTSLNLVGAVHPGQDYPFTVSLNGLASALNRADALSAP